VTRADHVHTIAQLLTTLLNGICYAKKQVMTLIPDQLHRKQSLSFLDMKDYKMIDHRGFFPNSLPVGMGLATAPIRYVPHPHPCHHIGLRIGHVEMNAEFGVQDFQPTQLWREQLNGVCCWLRVTSSKSLWILIFTHRCCEQHTIVIFGYMRFAGARLEFGIDITPISPDCVYTNGQ
jgi:hypothetical protein